MDPISIATSVLSIADNILRPRVLRRLGSESETAIRQLRTCVAPKVDICCIPDINERPLEQWTGQSESTNVNWLTDLLPQTFPHARILLFEYNLTVRTAAGFTRHVVKDQAYRMLEHLWSRRRGLAERRPLLLIGHKSGGLIAKSALIQSSAAFVSEEVHLKTIYLSTAGLFIINTVDQQPRLSRTWKDVLDKAMEKMPHPVVKTQDSGDRVNEWLEWQQDRFHAIANNVVISTLIVRHGSDTAERFRRWAKQYRHTDAGVIHRDEMVHQLERHRAELMMYLSLQDPDYVRLVEYMKECLESGLGKVKDKWEVHDKFLSMTAVVNDEFVTNAESAYQTELQEMIDVERRESTGSLTSHGGEDEVDQYHEKIADRRNITAEDKDKAEALLSGIDAAVDSLRQNEKRHGYLHARTLDALESLAVRCLEIGVLETAENMMQRLSVSWEYRFGPRNERLVHSLQNISAIKHRLGRHAEDSTYLCKVLEIRLYLLKALEDKVARIGKKSATVYSEDDIEKMKRKIERDKTAIATCQIDLASAYDMQDRFTEAEVLYSSVLNTRKSPTDECRRLALANQALQWQRRGKWAKAKAANIALLEAYDHESPSNLKDRRQIKNRIKEIKEIEGKLVKQRWSFTG